MDNSNNKHNYCNSQRQSAWFRCGLEDHFIVNFPKLVTSDKKVHWNKLNPKTRAYMLKKMDNTLEKSTDEINSHKI